MLSNTVCCTVLWLYSNLATEKHDMGVALYKPRPLPCNVLLVGMRGRKLTSNRSLPVLNESPLWNAHILLDAYTHTPSLSPHVCSSGPLSFLFFTSSCLFTDASVVADWKEFKLPMNPLFRIPN